MVTFKNFDYAANLLTVEEHIYSLENLRDYLIRVDQQLCHQHKIKTVWKPGKVVTDTYFVSEGQSYHRREITLSGEFVNVFDWDAIFFKASRNGLIEKFISYENSRH